MKILFTSPTYPPFNSGLGNAVEQQTKALCKSDFEIFVATSGAERRSYIDSQGVRVEHFKISGANSWLNPIRGDCQSYLNFLFDSSFDVIILNAWQNWATDLALKNINKISGRKYVYSHCVSTNTFFLSQPIRSFVRYIAWRFYWWSLLQVFHQLDGIIFLSKEGSDSRFDDLNLAIRNKIDYKIISNSISPTAFNILDWPNLNFKDRDRIISVGSYFWQKGFDFVLKAYAASIACNKIPLHLFGQKYSNYNKYLYSLAKDLGIDLNFIHFHEGVSGEELMNEYRNSLLILSGSHTECQPLVLIDASATGTPFIARSTGCISNMPGGVTVKNWMSMTKSINKFLSDSEYWEAISSTSQSAAFNIYHPKILEKELMSIVRNEK